MKTEVLLQAAEKPSRARQAGRARRGGNPICPRRAFLACLALHAPQSVALADFFSILLDGFGHDHVGQFAEQSFGFFPAETGIGDGDAVGQRFPLLPGLFAGIQVAFEH